MSRLQETNKETRKVNKVDRIPVGGNRDKLTISGKDPAYEYRIVNDIDNRIAVFKEGGWEEVRDSNIVFGHRHIDSGKSTSSVATKNVGKGVDGILMRIKKDWYEEDQEAKSQSIADSEESMKRKLNDGKDGKYGGVEFS